MKRTINFLIILKWVWYFFPLLILGGVIASGIELHRFKFGTPQGETALLCLMIFLFILINVIFYWILTFTKKHVRKDKDGIHIHLDQEEPKTQVVDGVKEPI
jgi:hypothetical protein